MTATVENIVAGFLSYVIYGAIVLIVLVAIFCTCSCDDKALSASNTTDTAELELETEVFAGEKLLTISTPQNITKFEYKAIPLFEEDDDLETPTNIITGSTEGEWRTVRFQNAEEEDAFVGRLHAVMGYYRQGRWEIELRALNAGGNIVYYGTTGAVYLNANRRNAFSVELRGVHSTGEPTAIMDIEFTGLETEENKGMVPSLRLEYIDGTVITITDDWETEKVKDGVIKYTLYKTGLAGGEVTGTIKLMTEGGLKNTAESFKTVLINGETTEVTGTLESGTFVRPTFDITEDKSEVKGRIVAGEGVTESLEPQRHFVTARSNEDAVFTFEQDESDTGGNDYTLTWYLDGEKVGDGINLLFSRTSRVGNYLIGVKVERDEKVFTTDVVLVVLPEEDAE